MIEIACDLCYNTLDERRRVKMLNQERHEAILKIVNEKGAASVAELTAALGVSESTIRRDLLELSSSGSLKKVHGGATLNRRQFIVSEDTVSDKQDKNVEEKRRIAKYAAEQISDSDFVFLDAGTTTLFMIDYLPDNLKASFVTNGISHAKLLSKRNFRVVILGGQLKSTTEAVIGLAAANNLQNYNFTKAFLGANGITENQGFSTPDSEEAFVKAAAINRSFVSYVLADSSKFGRVSSVSFATVDRACIITDKKPDGLFEKLTVIKVID